MDLSKVLVPGLAGAVVVAVVLVLCLSRYELTTGSAGSAEGLVFRLDRWTGQVAFCAPQFCKDIAFR